MARKAKIIKVGLDFDGVVAYNPFRVIRAPITTFKRKVLKIKRLKFFLPKYGWQIFLWRILHESSVFPADGVELLKKMVAKREIEVYLITARYDCLNQNLDKWLNKYNLKKLFKSVIVNINNEQPHEFKRRIITEKKCNFFVEDNLDIVEFLDRNCTVPVCWIYNLVDKAFFKRPGFSCLREALLWIKEQKV
jgi:hypothetical protein